MRFFTPSLLVAALLAVLVAGCAHVSPAVGTWAMSNGPGSGSLTLQQGGTGTLQMPSGGPQPVTWTEKDNQIALMLSGTPDPKSGGAPAPGMHLSATATLSEDKKTLSVPFGPIVLTMQKQADKCSMAASRSISYDPSGSV